MVRNLFKFSRLVFESVDVKHEKEYAWLLQPMFLVKDFLLTFQS